MNKPTLDKVRDYFYGRCNDGEEVRIQQWFADNGNSSEADRLLGALLDEVRSRFDYCLIDSPRWRRLRSKSSAAASAIPFRRAPHRAV